MYAVVVSTSVIPKIKVHVGEILGKWFDQKEKKKELKIIFFSSIVPVCVTGNDMNRSNMIFKFLLKTYMYIANCAM